MIAHMLALLMVVLFGIFFSILATQNTLSVPVQLFNYRFINVPLYLVALLSMLTGVVLSSGLSFLDWLSTAFTLHGKDTQIHTTENELTRLKKQNEVLKTENIKLRGEKEEIRDEAKEKLEDIREYKPSLLDRFRHTLSI